ncbi:MAG: DMT family transporter [Gammaproteobacteria bacterium]
MNHPLPQRFIAALHVSGSALLFAAMGACVKLVSAELALAVLVFFRSLFGLLALLPLLPTLARQSLATSQPAMHLARALFGLSAMACYFLAISQLRLAEAVLLSFSAPLFIPWFAFVGLREPLARGSGVSALVGFIGIALILKPDGGLFQWGALAGLGAGIFAAMAMVCVRRLARTEPATRVVFYYSVACTLLSAVPPIGFWETPGPDTWLPLLGMGLFATTGQLLLTRGYALAPAAQVGPFSYLAVVFAALFGWLLWHEVPDSTSLLGAALVSAAGILALRRESAVVDKPA